MDYYRLKGLKMEDYQHPTEKTAFEALRKLPFIDKLTAQFVKYLVSISALPKIQGNCFRITRNTCPEVYKMYLTALERLDMPKEYPLYAREEYQYNASAFGGDEPFICINSSILRDFEPDEITAVLGHELGHIKANHTIFDMMARMLDVVIAKCHIPGGATAMMMFRICLMNWFRAHEYSADRAGMIACGGSAPQLAVMEKFMGMKRQSPFINVTEESILAQKTYFDEVNNDMIAKLICLIQLNGMTHPYTISRIHEMHKWDESGEFDALINKYAEYR